MNLKRMLLLLALSAAISAVAGPQKVKTSVEKVTLFIDGAQVTRTRQVDLPAGNSTVVFTGLSPYLDDKSMQVSAKGPFTVTAVNRLFNHTDSLERSTRNIVLCKSANFCTWAAALSILHILANFLPALTSRS
jgi:hypothetical protein